MEYEIIGEKRVINGKNYYCPGDSDNGYCYKNEQAFKENPDEVCYIPEHAFDDGDVKVIDGREFVCVPDDDAFTRRDLEKECEGYITDDGKPLDAEILFSELDWSYPSTLINEYNWGDQIIIE